MQCTACAVGEWEVIGRGFCVGDRYPGRDVHGFWTCDLCDRGFLYQS